MGQENGLPYQIVKIFVHAELIVYPLLVANNWWYFAKYEQDEFHAYLVHFNMRNVLK